MEAGFGVSLVPAFSPPLPAGVRRGPGPRSAPRKRAHPPSPGRGAQRRRGTPVASPGAARRLGPARPPPVSLGPAFRSCTRLAPPPRVGRRRMEGQRASRFPVVPPQPRVREGRRQGAAGACRAPVAGALEEVVVLRGPGTLRAAPSPARCGERPGRRPSFRAVGWRCGAGVAARGVTCGDVRRPRRPV